MQRVSRAYLSVSLGLLERHCQCGLLFYASELANPRHERTSLLQLNDGLHDPDYARGGAEYKWRRCGTAQILHK